MELAGKVHKQTPVTALAVRLPWFGWTALSVLTGVTIVVMSAVIVTRRDRHDPFMEYRDLFGDDPRHTALSLGFTCRDTGVGRLNARTVSSFCSRSNVNEVFSEAYLWVADGTIKEFSFSPRENTLRLGDLALLWGKPRLWLNCETAVVVWPARQIIGVLARPEAGRVNHFSPVISVSFTLGVSPNWGRTMLNDVLHNCGDL